MILDVDKEFERIELIEDKDEQKKQLKLLAVSVTYFTKYKLLMADTMMEHGQPGEFKNHMERMRNGAEESFILKKSGRFLIDLIKEDEEYLKNFIIGNADKFNRTDLMMVYHILTKRPEIAGDDIELVLAMNPTDPLKDNYGKSGSVFGDRRSDDPKDPLRFWEP